MVRRLKGQPGPLRRWSSLLGGHQEAALAGPEGKPTGTQGSAPHDEV